MLSGHLETDAGPRRTTLDGRPGQPGAGRWALFSGFALGGAALGMVALLAATASSASTEPPALNDNFRGLIVLTLVLIPYSAMGGALGAVYGCRIRAGRCAALLAAGVLIAVLVPITYVHRVALTPLDSSSAGAIAGSAALQLLAALGTWSLLRRRVEPDG